MRFIYRVFSADTVVHHHDACPGHHRDASHTARPRCFFEHEGVSSTIGINRCVFSIVFFSCLRRDAYPGHHRDASRTAHKGVLYNISVCFIGRSILAQKLRRQKCQGASPRIVAMLLALRARDAFLDTEV